MSPVHPGDSSPGVDRPRRKPSTRSLSYDRLGAIDQDPYLPPTSELLRVRPPPPTNKATSLATLPKVLSIHAPPLE
uniref:Uncharacterized protein n=1 Tax=Triticum urartu TaxID=4572 RepID=A0A8R7U6C3_TRIUA